MITLAADTDKPDADEFARILAGGSFGAIEKDIRGGEANSGPQSELARGAKEFPAATAGF